jgi:hypothetical protein
MEGIEAKMPGSHLEGKDFQLKGADSLKRKLATELTQSAGNLDVAAAGINDALRYTLVLPEATYAAGVARAVELLQAADMQVTKLKNFWKTNKDTSGYRGINLTVYDQATKQVFELQLHTDASLVAKEADHGWYDWRRVPNVPQIEIDYAQAQSDAIFGRVSFPDLAEKLGLKDGKVVVVEEG